GGAYPDAERLADPARDPQHPALTVEIQAVAGLDLQCGHAIGHERPCPRQRTREQGILVRGPGRAHGGDDAAAVARDFLVAGAVQALLELAGAVAGEHQVRVTVHQPGRDPAAVGLDHFRGERVDRARQFRTRPDPGDAAVAPGERTVGDGAVSRVTFE